MRYFIFLISLALSLASGNANSFSCTEIYHGIYPSANDASLASMSASGVAGSLGSADIGYRGYEESWPDSDSEIVSTRAVVYFCSDINPGNRTYKIHLYGFIYNSNDSCPSGTEPYGDAGNVCICTNGGSLNAQSGQCEANDDFPQPDPSDYDDSANTGGDGNSNGGDPGSECNWLPEGCAPYDRAPDAAEIDDIEPPTPDNTPAPDDAVTTTKSESNNPDGSTTSSETKEWKETDGSIVKQTTTTTTNPDGSKTTTTILDRTSPDASHATTTTTTDTDADGNTTISGTTSETETEKSNHASGGGTCDAAPSCNGDAIACAILSQQWLTRCDSNTEYADSDCSLQPTCEGDPLMCASLINDWQDRCALERADSDADDHFAQNGFKTAEQYAEDGGILGTGDETDLSDMADGVFNSRSGVGGSCPQPIPIDAGDFGQYEIALDPFCDFAESIYWLVLLAGYIQAAYHLFRAITSPK
ncbi:hypothetical protein MO867_17455 [Microbulbifer sp. OS29]|uniref:TspB protein n=1 Tax=Microbulbifer okhotskensis TaxID=2926617 RepID=A0A9X2J906_9GAMM|nr:virulence factor TspB C-terminal domain-related protein [Microbulbifer okhotskensis]MCO1336121.1 hypothetical protein [Microbulbifer okhotskensis]